MNKQIIALLLALAVLLCGCAAGSSAQEKGGLIVYRLDMESGGGGLVREFVEQEKNGNAAEKMMEALNSPAADPEHASAFPKGVEIEKLSIKNGLASVEMSWEYLALMGTDRLLAQGALVLSLSTLDEVCAVDIYCMEERQAAGLTVESFVEADGICRDYERSLKLYLPKPGYEYLVPRTLQSSGYGNSSQVEAILRELFLSIGGGVEDTKLISANIAEGICRVELSQEFYGKSPAAYGEGKLIIYSVVNSLCRIPGVEAVTLTVEGMDVESYGDYSTKWPLEPDMSLVNYQEN